MEAFLTSTAVVALAEIGDKTMLLAIVLATRFRAPLPIIAGIFFATIANHALAALLGATAAEFLAGDWFRYLVAASFIVMGLWTLIPDTFDEDDKPKDRSSAFLTTLVAFFLVEMGDKTQLATIALGARYHDVALVAAGTTLGMMIANVPAVYLGEALVKRVPLGVVRTIAAALFVAIGLWMLAEVAGWI
ncbi:MAG: TMEM165/GDT1 family protein [Sphingomonadales bacterium]|nr:TMEM165/GDT1 family protein [Sphingomonadales bacterium]MBD3773553.1 TMEM165/GDT1 family protein [Paracoccaceae bacterium]